ncbi:MAG: GNAT family N-acetyltransferase [Gammaproteobacteria bacterium]|nr:MAG: GNAT family N-acetyltransferase [Gammaproteobacteria bacterium]
MTQSANHNHIQDIRHYRQADPIAATIASASPSPFKDLTFPLNVYAHALLLQEGKAAYLHYGLFQDDKTSLKAAQQFSTDLLLAKLPPPPCRILEVGIGLGTTFSLLQQRGYTVHGITPDAQQIAYIQKSLGTTTPVSCHSLETFSAAAGSFDVVLFQESAQYIEPLVIFNQALDLLSPAGQLFIIDEFTLQHDAARPGGLHLINNMITLAERFGFELLEKMDLSAMAAPTLDYLLAATRTHRQKLLKDLALSDEQLNQLDESNRTYREKYASGHYGYALLHFRKKAPLKWRLRLLEKNQTPEIFNLFKKTFHQDITPSFWHWKYGSNASRAIGVWRENELIAHYGGISRKILFFGQPQTAVQIGDVMVDASERGTLTRKGPFFLMAATFLERYIGYNKPYLIGFGFPNVRAMKVAERLGLYAEVGQMVEFSWTPLAKWPRVKTRLHPIDRADDPRAAAAVEECWRKMAENLRTALVGIRDWPYLQRRYLNHPTQRYQLMLVRNRFGGRARGILVLRHDTFGCEIVDIIAPLSEIPLLVLHARRLAGINGHDRLFCRITENFAAYFAAAGGTKQALDIRIPASIWDAAPSVDSLRNHWWLMSGDTDFR